MLRDVAAAVINYQTPDLLEPAVRSLRQFYPDLPLLIVDNGSRDASCEAIRALCASLGEGVEALYLDQNIFHGPAMDLALRRLKAEYVYVFDSDTETVKGGFLEGMRQSFDQSHRVYGAGRISTVNKRGFASPTGTPVLVSAYMMLRRSLYLGLPPFEHHGLPALKNFQAASAQGLNVAHFPIDDYVHHLGRGTASRFGYGLGFRSKVEYLLNRMGL